MDLLFLSVLFAAVRTTGTRYSTAGGMEALCSAERGIVLLQFRHR